MSSLASALSSVASGLDELLPSDETLRQRLTGDTSFTEPLTLIFELILPDEGVFPFSSRSFLFPLQIAPNAMGMSEPFSVEVTPTQQGGLFVEENGIVQRRIRIRGTTGFFPHPLPISPPKLTTPSTGRSFSRSLPAITATNNLSGQRHFQFLQDKIIRLYADFKRDPQTSSLTQLRLHDTQNDEHWIVVPMSFGQERSAQSPLEYPYDIDLLVVDKADALPFDKKTSDRSLLQAMGDVLRSTQNFLRRATSAVNQLTSVQQELSLAVHGVGAVFGQAATLIDAVASFVEGTSELVQSPYQAIFSIAQGCENALKIAANTRNLGLTIANWPRPIEQRFFALTTAAEQLGLAPKSFVPVARTLKAQQTVVNAPVTADVPLKSFAAIQAQGSSGLPSDAALASSRSTDAIGITDYPSTVSYTVQEGDSLTSLAVRFLGDPKAWSVIAAANNMTPPIMPTSTAVGVPSAFFGSLLQVGQRLLIPSAAIPQTSVANDAVLGALPTQDPETQSLGIDAQTVVNSKGQMDWALGSTEGMPDIGTIQGEANFEQALNRRLLVEQGTAVLYPNLGLPLLIGTRQASADWQQIRLRVQQTLSVDPRVRQVENIDMATQNDGLAIAITLQRVDSAGASQLTLAV